MKSYQGRALWTAPRRPRRGIRPGWYALALLAVAVLGWAQRDRIARSHPYRALFTIRQVDVSGTVFLSEAEVRRKAGLAQPQDFLRADLEAARERLEREPRVARARIARALPRRIVIRVEERTPVALVRAGRLLETDAEGRILPALVSGALPDVPLVSGVTVRDARPGRRIEDPRYGRALRHLRALEHPEIGLAHPVSQVDVSDARTTVVTLAPDGVDVLLPAEPQPVRTLSALRVVLADLAARGLSASRVDLRGDEVIAVRPLPAPAGGIVADTLQTRAQEPRRG